MDNKVFGLVFLAVISSAFLFFGIANAGAFAVDRWLFPTEEFGDNTYIGTTDVSDMEVTEAKSLFSGRVESWRGTAELLVTYQDATANYPLDNAEILVDETVNQADTGSQNGFVFQLSPDTTRMFLTEHFPVADFSEDDVETVTDKLEQALTLGQQQTRVTISDDIAMLNRETVSATAFSHGLESPGAADVLAALSGLEIAADSQFSFLDFLAETDYGSITDSELTEIASAIYGAVLQTNFLIDERSIGETVPSNVPLGQEAAINRSLGVDFVFTNPNDSLFHLDVETTDESLRASLSGYPFVYSYLLSTGPEETVEPRLIRQFSAFVTSGFAVEEPGSDGVRVEVLRTVMAEGTELETESVSTDFYPPVHRVEVYPLAASETAPGENGNTDPDSGSDTTDPDGNETGDGDSDSDSNPDGSGSNDADSDDSDSSGSSTGSDDENQDGTRDDNDNGKSQEPIYDKGGSLVNPE